MKQIVTLLYNPNKSFTLRVTFLFNLKSSISILILGISITLLSLASCSGSKGGGSIGSSNSPTNSLSVMPSVVSGVAPLAVFFDATGTTSTSTARPFHDLQYTWTFGDPASAVTWSPGDPASAGSWAYGSNAGNNSKNEATGPVAAHVFQTPGTYTVAVSVTDGTNTMKDTTQITVTDPNVVFAGTNTICVAASTASQNASSSYCPSGASSVVQSDFATAINTYSLSGKRVLFNRGDTFTNNSTAAITHTGPGIVGAYGPFTTAKPVIQATVNVPILNLSSPQTPTISDWRIMDLELNGLAGTQTLGAGGNGGINQVLFLRLYIHDVNNGMQFSSDLLDYFNANKSPGHSIWDQLYIVDSNISHITAGVTSGYGIFFAASRFAMLGTIIDNNVAGQHIVRATSLYKSIFSNNQLSRNGPYGHPLKIHATTWFDPSTNKACNLSSCNPTTDISPTAVSASPDTYTEYVVISDNEFIPATGTPWDLIIAPENSLFDERLRHILVERNWFTIDHTIPNTLDTSIQIEGDSSDVEIRNNISDLTGAVLGRSAFTVSTSAYSPLTNDIRFYNNTSYASDASSGSSAFPLISSLGSTAVTNLTAENNLHYAPLAPRIALVAGTTGSGYYESNNLVSGQNSSTFYALNSSSSVSASSLFITSSPLVPSDFKPTTGSYAIGKGTTVPVWSDFFQIPATGTPDLGAVDH